ADAVLYEGYLLYPYRASSDRNRARWQFGVLGPPGAAEAGLGEDATMAAQFLVRDATTLTLTVRFLHLQRRRAEASTPDGTYRPAREPAQRAGSRGARGRGGGAQFQLRPFLPPRPAGIAPAASSCRRGRGGVSRRRSLGARTPAGHGRTGAAGP